MRSPPHRWSSAALVVVGCTLLAVVASWPLVPWSGAVFPSSPDMPDLNVSMWLPWHLAEQLSQGASPFDAPLLQHPHGQRISLLVWNLGLQLAQLPLYAAFPPWQAYNLSLVAMGAGNGLGGYVLGRAIAPSDRAGGLLGAAVLATSPFAWHELTQGRVEQGFVGLFAVVVAGLWRLEQQPERRLAVGTGLAWGLAGLCYWFYGYFLALLVGVLVGVAALRRRWSVVRSWATASATAAAVAAPFALVLIAEALGSGSVYRQSTAEDPELLRRLQFVIHTNSLGLRSSPLWWLAAPTTLREVLPVGTVALVLGGTLALRRGARWLGPMALAGLVLALGPTLQWQPGEALRLGDGGRELLLPLAGLRELVPGFTRLWWPYRFSVFWAVGAAGCGAALLARLPSARLRWGLSVGLVLLVLGELRWAQQRTDGGLLWDQPRPVPPHAFFEGLAEAETVQPVLFLPFQAPTSGRVLWQAVHHQPVSIGLGDSDEMLVTSDVQQWVAADPVLRWLQAAGRRRDRSPSPLSGAALRDHLRGLGFRWAVLWRSPPQPGQLERYQAAFGARPDLTEDMLVAWEL